MATTVDTTTSAGSGIDRAHRRVIAASSLGTMFEWYDFYLYGSLAAIIGKQFFAGVNETTGFIFALLAFAAGFAVRPFGAIIFGRLGDLAGRKHTFLITIVIMGVATALVGVLPTQSSIGIAAPIILIGLRLLQGLAVGLRGNIPDSVWEALAATGLAHLVAISGLHVTGCALAVLVLLRMGQFSLWSSASRHC